MTIHYHGTPITPPPVLQALAGKCFCVSFADPRDVHQAHLIGQSVMLDNGAFTAWRQNRAVHDWTPFYSWSDEWLDCPTTWAVIPDVIDAGSQEQDALIREWPHGYRGAPVWHMDEPMNRLLRLLDEWPRVCIGSTAEYRVVLSVSWQARMDEAWNEIGRRHRRTPNVHMLRGMQLVRRQRWPFASVDSADVARNHNRDGRPKARADRWDAGQCPIRYVGRAVQMELV